MNTSSSAHNRLAQSASQCKVAVLPSPYKVIGITTLFLAVLLFLATALHAAPMSENTPTTSTYVAEEATGPAYVPGEDRNAVAAPIVTGKIGDGPQPAFGATPQATDQLPSEGTLPSHLAQPITPEYPEPSVGSNGPSSVPGEDPNAVAAPIETGAARTR